MMNDGIRLRLVAFILATLAMVSLIVWTARVAERRVGQLRDRFTQAQLQSFEIADHFQESIQQLNNSVLRYGAYHDPNDWARFGTASKQLDHWIDEQRPLLSSEGERTVLDQINAAYDDYLAAAREIVPKLKGTQQGPIALAEFAGFQKQSERILNLSLQLLKAHHTAMDAFLADSKNALNLLQWVLLGSLALLLASAVGIALVVYREMIAPLRLKLVQSQQLVERHEKLASLGMLAAGVAHEIRNPLTAIKAWLYIQQKHLEPGTAEHADTEVIAGEINRLERIVKDFLQFARPSEPEFVTVSSDEPLRGVCRLLSPQLEKTNIRLTVDGTPGAAIRIDPQQIKQVLINLIQNAADSIGQNGTITLRTRLASMRLSERPTDVVILEVADTGKGIPPEVGKRLFDPFFTTKEAGTGLGLSIAARILEKHGGALQYQTQVNHGTTFGIVLPRA
jgi:signal transduction histidine kinase